MLNERPLRKLYEMMVERFPLPTHDETEVLREIAKGMQRDGLKTYYTRKELSEQKLEFVIHQAYPLNYFLNGMEKYLLQREVPEKEVCTWIRRVIEERLLFRP